MVVGGGLAGLNTVVALRARGFAGRVTLLGAEPEPPYDRPPLSKQLLRGEVDDTTLPARWDDLDADLRLGVRATGLAEGRVGTDQGGIGCDAVVVATGSAPVRLPGDGRQRTLRTVADARALRAALRPGVRLAVVGAGWIGAEVATAASAAGCAVTVVEASDRPFAAALPAEAVRPMLRWWRDAGVELLLGTPVRAVTPYGLELAGGASVQADEVLAAVGVRPETSWLGGGAVSLAADGGVLVDERLLAAPGVCAVGDVAAWPSRRYGRLLRVEHWDNALRAPAVAAATLVGGEETYDPVPYVWSEQFGRYVQYAGDAAAGDTLVWRGDPDADAAWTACWLRAGRLAAVLAVDRPRDAVQGRKLCVDGAVLDPARLADPDVPLRRAVA